MTDVTILYHMTFCVIIIMCACHFLPVLRGWHTYHLVRKEAHPAIQSLLIGGLCVLIGIQSDVIRTHNYTNFTRRQRRPCRRSSPETHFNSHTS